MCGSFKLGGERVIGHFDILDGKNQRQAKFPMSTLAKQLDIT